MYDARSRWAHGSHIALAASSKTNPEPDPDGQDSGADSEVVAKISLFQTALRTIVRRCIEAPEFAAAFADEASVRDRWPVRI
jgi:hypothetical protein